MRIMIMGAVNSADAYIADTNGDVSLQFDWLGIGDMERMAVHAEAPC
jgi:hypothetical protein